MAVIFEETTLPFFEDEGGVYAFATESDVRLFELNVGDYYDVVWDGVRYTVQAQFIEFTGMNLLVVGNMAFINSDFEDTGEPFTIAELSVEGVYQYLIGTMLEGDTHTIAIYSKDESTGVSIILYDQSGKAVTHKGIDTIVMDTPDKEQGATFTYGTAIENAEYEPDYTDGNQKITIETGKFLKEFTIIKPENLVSEHIKKNVGIAGVIGSMTYIENIDTEEAMNALLIADNIGNAYRFVGDTTENFINGDIYVVEDNA